MGKKVFGRVVDNENKAVEFAVVYVSDSNGKPIGNVNTTTDDKGRFVFNSLNDSDFLTSRLVGLEPKTVSVKSAINVPSPIGDMPTLAMKMNPSAGANLQEVVVKPKDDKPQDTTPKDDKPKEEEPKKGMSKGLKIGLIIGGGLLLLIIVGVIIKQSTKDK
jgi:hypothetical protein